MMTVEVRFNSKSRSANREPAMRFAEKLGGDLRDDEKTMSVTCRKYDKRVADLIGVVEEWSGTEVIVDGMPMPNPRVVRSILACPKRGYCDGLCDYASRWNQRLQIAAGDPDEELAEVSERNFPVDEYPELLVSANESTIQIDRTTLEQAARNQLAIHDGLCPRFDLSKYVKPIQRLPSVIQIRRVVINE